MSLDSESPTVPTSRDQRVRRRGNAVVAIVITLAVIAGVLGFVVYSESKSKSAQPSPANKTPQVTAPAPAPSQPSPPIEEVAVEQKPVSMPKTSQIITLAPGEFPEYDDIENNILTLDEILSPYVGPILVDQENENIYNKVMTGYQGWFGHQDDGYNFGERHWGKIMEDPPRCSFDMWPDMSELDDDERYITNFKYPDGTPAYVFSSRNKKTVMRHFKWMREHDIHGVFKQRFGVRFVRNGEYYDSADDLQVLAHVREGANRYGRLFALMYDVSFDAETCDGMIQDWTNIYHKMRLTDSPNYMRHKGGPVVSFWGYADKNRPWDPVAAEKLFKFMTDPANGGCTIKVGLPDNAWRHWSDERMEILKKYVTIVSPWTVGRYRSPEQAADFFERNVHEDLEVCEMYGFDYYPVIFPGFSWTNLKHGAPLNHIPRLGGRFFWSQAELVKQFGINMVYVAMFDEVDEATSIFKVTNNPPVGRFATYEGYPSDYYLQLTGLIGKMLAGEPVSFPNITPEPDTYVPLTALEFYQDENYFSEEITAQWQEVFNRIPVIVDKDNFGKWALEINNVSSALNMHFRPWTDITGIRPNKYVLVMAQQKDDFTTGDVSMDQVTGFVRQCLRSGSVMLVMSDGLNPMQKPDRGKDARSLGFILSNEKGSSECTVEFHPALGERLSKWTWKDLKGKTPKSRLMSRDDYPDARQYVSLAKVFSADGTHIGDAAAMVQPGGDIGTGQIVYVSNMLSAMPKSRKKELLQGTISIIADIVK